jgi:hypothetical protein
VERAVGITGGQRAGRRRGDGVHGGQDT